MGLKRHILSIGVVAGCALGAAAPSIAGDIPVESADTTFNVHVTSLKEIHFLRVVHQAYDFSCGSAAVATLLTYHYGHPILETSVLKAMFEVGEQEKIKKEGFSLLDMKRYLASIGFRAEGYQVGLDKIAEVGVPGIVLIKTKGYLHFVVLKGIRGDSVLLGDPALGAKFVSRAEFTSMWNGIFFVIVGHTNEAKKEFNSTEDWASVSSAPLSAVNAGWSLANTLLMTPGRNNF
ncbi:MAG TPA: C39 family peptidase [Stellaceae bacterium]|nr:C39 family peptidase [Stellaceae bacterium]